MTNILRNTPPKKPINAPDATLIGLKTELSLLSKKAPINAPIKGPKTIPKGKIKIPTSRPIVVPLIAFFPPPNRFTPYI